jgi:signal transduction histidine kinase
MAGSLQDVTDRKELEKELSRISTYEQQRIGQELHDGTQQELAGLGLIAHSLAESLAATGARETKMATRLSEGLGEALERLRRLARGLIPLYVYERGLVSALAELAVKVNELPELTCTFQCDENLEIGDSFVATQLHAIAQEAVTNAMKHSRAERILISLHGNHEGVTLEICDDGRGIQCKSDQMTGMGLRIMRYRAGLVGAVLDIQPADGGGTLVTCRMPNPTAPP